MKKILSVSIALTVITASGIVHSENLVTDQAKKSGVKTCLPAIKAASDFLFENGNIGTYSKWSKANPDKDMFTTTVEQNFEDGTSISSLTATPTPIGGCSFVYEQIMHFQKSCTATAKSVFAKFDYESTLNKNVTVLAAGDVHVFLLPIENSQCIAMKKEIIIGFQPKDK